MATYNPNTTTAELGNQNKAVADLQTQLNAKGANLKVDSKYGPLTQAAAAKYGVTVPSDVITSDKLTPTKPLNLPDAKPATFGGVDGAIDGLVQQQKVVDETPAQSEYLKALKESGYISSSVDRSAQDAAKKQSDLYTSQIEQEQLANRRQIERLQKNMEGALASGINIESERLTRESLSKQADLAILQTAANRNYDTASAIADRQVAMKMEQSRANLEALKMLDQREYGEITARKEREFKKQEEAEKQISQLKLNVAQYGGGVGLLNQLSAIDTTKPGAFDQAIKIAGKYASDPLDRAIKQAQLNKLNADISVTDSSGSATTVSELFKNPKLKSNEQIQNAGAVLSSITEFGKNINTGKVKGYGFLGGGFLPEAVSGQKAIATRGNVAGIEGKLQQWLSGASLSKGQEKLVDKMIPGANDTDATVKTKLNQLANYMLSDIKGRASTQGVDFNYDNVDVFGNESTSTPEDDYLNRIEKTINNTGILYSQGGYVIN